MRPVRRTLFRGTGFAVGVGFQYSDGEAAEPGKVLRTIAGGVAAAIVIAIPVVKTMTGIFDYQVAAIDRHDLIGVSLFRSPASVAKGDFQKKLPDFYL